MTLDHLRTLNALIAAGSSPFPTAFTNQTYGDLDGPGRWAVALDDYGGRADGSNALSTASASDDAALPPTRSPIGQDAWPVQFDGPAARLIAPSSLNGRLVIY